MDQGALDVGRDGLGGLRRDRADGVHEQEHGLVGRHQHVVRRLDTEERVGSRDRRFEHVTELAGGDDGLGCALEYGLEDEEVAIGLDDAAHERPGDDPAHRLRFLQRLARARCEILAVEQRE